MTATRLNPALLWPAPTRPRSPWPLTLLLLAGLACWLMGERCERRAPAPPPIVAGIALRRRVLRAVVSAAEALGRMALVSIPAVRARMRADMQELDRLRQQQRGGLTEVTERLVGQEIERLRREVAEVKADLREAESEIDAAEDVLDLGGVPGDATIGRRCAHLLHERDAAMHTDDESARWARQIQACAVRLMRGRSGAVIVTLTHGEETMAIGQVDVVDEPLKPGVN